MGVVVEIIGLMKCASRISVLRGMMVLKTWLVYDWRRIWSEVRLLISVAPGEEIPK